MKLQTCLLLLLASVAFLGVFAREKADNCEVCHEVLQKVSETLTKADLKDLVKIESKIQAYCDQKKISQSHKKICYYITPIKREISQPLKNGVPVEKLCPRLKKKSAEVCAVTAPVKVEKGKTDYNSMRVKQLKSILRERGVSCENCLEKKEFVKRCKETEDMEL